MLLEVRIVVVTEDAGGYWELCVRGFGGTVNILLSNLGACDIGSYDMCTFLYAYYTSKQKCYAIYVKKSSFTTYIISTHTINPFLLTSTCLYRTPGRTYTHSVNKG